MQERVESVEQAFLGLMSLVFVFGLLMFTIVSLATLMGAMERHLVAMHPFGARGLGF